MIARIKHIMYQTANNIGNAVLTPPYGGLGAFHNHGPRTQRKVALTFDDGPNRPCTEATLDVLGELNVKATFFVVGKNASWHPDIVLRAYNEGHDIGNHSMLHRRKVGIIPDDGSHIDDAATEISSIIGCVPRLYRPPWGWLTPWEAFRLKRRNYAIIGWDVDSIDWHIPEDHGDLVAERVKRGVQPGSIILCHDGYPCEQEWSKTETVRALRQFIPALHAEGYEFVTVSDLLAVPAYGPLPMAVVPEA